MPKIIYRNILGTSIFNEHIKLLIREKFGKYEQLKKDCNKPDEKQLSKILEFFRDRKYFNEFHKENLKKTKDEVKKAISKDFLIIQAIKSIDELKKAANIISKKTIDFYSLYNPELEGKIKDNKRIMQIISRKEDRKEKDSIGTDFKNVDMAAVRDMASTANEVFLEIEKLEKYLETAMDECCPNLNKVAGSLMGAKLIELGGGLRNIAKSAASKIQLLGAEKALFRHMKDKKNRCPKYGVLHEHQIVQQAKEKGKATRLLADKITIAARVDYFKGDYIGDKLLKQVKEKLR